MFITYLLILLFISNFYYVSNCKPQENVEDYIGENVISSDKYNELQRNHLKSKSEYQRVMARKLDLEISVNEITKVIFKNM